MKRVLLVLLCVISILLFCGCNVTPTKYKRISFVSESLGDDVKIASDAAVVYLAKETVREELPIYEISKHAISEKEFQQMEVQLGITNWYFDDYDGYEVFCRAAPYSDPNRGYFYTLNMSGEELEGLAWETFKKIPFLKGEYEYVGITGEMSQWTMESGEYRPTEVTVSFYRYIDGVCVVGNERCDLTFDASGLVEVHIAMYDYEEIGTMDMVSLGEAKERLKAPDYFSLEESGSAAKELQVDRVQLYMVNQYSRGCTILQPIYTFYGTATLESGNQTEFKSRIIAIPEEMTYEE